ncbi:MAG: Serine O-acetyltransferase [uncultured bacterium]|nr:MAG: Serine O-acetyltransferase [uncultured bacterium]
MTNKKAPLAPNTLYDVAAHLCERPSSCESPCPRIHPLPSSETVLTIIHALRSVLFPFHFGNFDFSPDRQLIEIQSRLERMAPVIKEQLWRGLCHECRAQKQREYKSCEKKAEELTNLFLLKLPKVNQLLDQDVTASYAGDPAAKFSDEAIFCYPGIQAMTHYRLAHELYCLGVPLIPRMITEQAHSVTGIDIHPGAQIGNNFFIDHGTGVVIGETCIIGNNVRLYQGVTLGAKSFPLDAKGHPVKGIARHPIVEDNVIIYSETTILGRVTIGHDSIIGGNVWLTHDVPPNSRITQMAALQTHFEQGSGI